MTAAARCPHGSSSLFLSTLLVLSTWAVARDWPCLALLTIWAMGCTIRLRYEDRQVKADCWIFVLCFFWSQRDRLTHEVIRRWNNQAGLGISVKSEALLVASSITVILIFGTILSQLVYAESNKAPDLAPNTWKWALECPKARIFPCQTAHARIFPKKHAFSYSYLQCGFPIIPQGIMTNGMRVSTGQDRTLGRWWLRIQAEDYLDRGYADIGFYGKLKRYLREQGVGDADWSYAYLITAPRFFGYAFNPVSFWYIYDEEHELKKMILEVNNTFGERRMYLLDGSSSPSPPRTVGSDASGKSEPDVREAVQEVQSRFTDIWMKDFHVSPFNSRKGSYALKVLNPFPRASYEDPRIDNTITLKSSKDHGKLVARLYSTGKSIDLETMGLRKMLCFIISWWWVGLLTVPRITRQAFTLFFTRKLHVWYRPEVRTSSIGRLPTPSEIILHNVFQAYLHQLVHQTPELFCIIFKSGLPDISPQTITTARPSTSDRPIRNLELRVLTPSFYSRFVHYAYTSEAIDRECVFTDEKNRTMWLCHPQLLSLLLSTKSSPRSEPEQPVLRSRLDNLRWHFLQKLRCPPPPAASAPSLLTLRRFHVSDIRVSPLSELDCFVRSVHGSAYSAEYRRTVTKLFLAQRLALGCVEAVEVADLLVRVVLVGFGVMQLGALSRNGMSWGYMQLLMDSRHWWLAGRAVGAVLSCHVYQISKGYT